MKIQWRKEREESCFDATFTVWGTSRPLERQHRSLCSWHCHAVCCSRSTLNNASSENKQNYKLQLAAYVNVSHLKCAAISCRCSAFCFFGDGCFCPDCRARVRKTVKSVHWRRQKKKLVQQNDLKTLPYLTSGASWARCCGLKGRWLVRVRRRWRRKRRAAASGCWALGCCSFPESCVGDELAGCLGWNLWLAYGQTGPLQSADTYLKLLSKHMNTRTTST